MLKPLKTWQIEVASNYQAVAFWDSVERVIEFGKACAVSNVGPVEHSRVESLRARDTELAKHYLTLSLELIFPYHEQLLARGDEDAAAVAGALVVNDGFAAH